MMQSESKLKSSRNLFQLEEIGRLFFYLFAVNRSSAKDFPVCPSLELCPSGWLYFQRKCYYLSESEANWNSSQSLCSSHNASLLVIENDQELVREERGVLVSPHLSSRELHNEPVCSSSLLSWMAWKLTQRPWRVTACRKLRASSPCKQQTSVLAVDVYENARGLSGLNLVLLTAINTHIEGNYQGKHCCISFIFN